MKRNMEGNKPRGGRETRREEKRGGNNIRSKDAYSDGKQHASDQVGGNLAAHHR
jgi:hypothetical protein